MWNAIIVSSRAIKAETVPIPPSAGPAGKRGTSRGMVCVTWQQAVHTLLRPSLISLRIQRPSLPRPPPLRPLLAPDNSLLNLPLPQLSLSVRGCLRWMRLPVRPQPCLLSRLPQPRLPQPRCLPLWPPLPPSAGPLLPQWRRQRWALYQANGGSSEAETEATEERKLSKEQRKRKKT